MREISRKGKELFQKLDAEFRERTYAAPVGESPMIIGVILDNGTPMIELKVHGAREESTIEGILDTGFNGFICLPTSIAVALGLELIDTITSELADATLVEEELVFAGQAEWDGTFMDIRITLTRSEETLIGTAFLTGYRVEIDYTARTLTIEKTP